MNRPRRERIDVLLVSQGLCPSRERAQALIMAGRVLVNDVVVSKAGTRVDAAAAIRLRGADMPFVSRGGIKLDGALRDLGVNIADKVVLDVGASTGGFTDCCLQRGARRVLAVDVGTNQLDFRLRSDARVLSFENVNARHMTPDLFPEPADVAVMDVSFISLTLVLPATAACLRADGEIVAMVKPQFEAGRAHVGKGGVVRDEAAREAAVQRVIDWAKDNGFAVLGRADSQLPGPHGNREVFLHMRRVAAVSP
ncbi:MAG: TlyA family RNA methyltransferase [Myxococcales bacterium]|jgi:23S rRNA (cytidine1920-2'-O)/16S rRNA (cytidine1409-2'-O)-methyltransferase|nr:TlyA family RNA methyltransferase [Myxococcales bacterium]